MIDFLNELGNFKQNRFYTSKCKLFLHFKATDPITNVTSCLIFEQFLPTMHTSKYIYLCVEDGQFHLYAHFCPTLSYSWIGNLIITDNEKFFWSMECVYKPRTFIKRMGLFLSLQDPKWWHVDGCDSPSWKENPRD